MKCIQVTDQVWKDLKTMKLHREKKRINDVIEELIEKEKQGGP